MQPQVLARVLSHAKVYAIKDQSPSSQNTFGYFTRHPVAPINQRRLAQLLKLLGQEQPRQRVLDLACGAGLITSALALLSQYTDSHHRVIGADLNADEIELAKRFAHTTGSGAVFEVLDAMVPQSWAKIESLLEGPPSIVILAYALHHFPDASLFIETMSRALKPGAKLIINEENPEAPLFRLKHWVRTWLQKDTEVEHHQTYSGWKSLLDRHGFEVSDPVGIDIAPIDPWGPVKRRWSLVFTATKR